MKALRDSRHLKHYMFFAISFLIIIILLTQFKYLYGSNLDWNSQHYAFLHYFRELFYDTKDFFPSFAFNLGGGENIYFLSYYGLFSPVMWISLLFPFVPMREYVIIISILAVFISIIMMYRWLNTKYNARVAFFATLAFEFATPIIFHSHRHIMFIAYMPFLILALQGAEDYIEENKRIKLIISTFLMLMSNYFFGVAGIFVVCIYGLAVYIKRNPDSRVKRLITKGAGFISNIIVSILMAAILWLPTLWVIISGRSEENVDIGWKDLLMPAFNGDIILYGNYAMGLTGIFIVAILYGIISRNNHIKMLSIVFCLISTFGIFVFILNGGMYLDGKVLIPFIPLGIYLIAYFIDNLLKRQIELNKLMILTCMIIVLIFFSDWKVERLPLLIEIAIIFVVAKLYYIKKIKGKWVFVFMIIPMTICLAYNFSDSLVPIDMEKSKIDKEEELLATELQGIEPNIYRTANDVNQDVNINKIYNMDYLTTTIYSSLINNEYRDFFFNEIYNENSFRNDAMLNQSRNIIFNMYMGNKYYLSQEPKLAGYEKIATEGSVSLYKNDNVYPIGYVSSDLMSRSEYESLDYPYNVEALMMKTIVEDERYNQPFRTSVKPIDISSIYNLTEDINYEKRGETSLFIKVDREGTKVEKKELSSSKAVSLKLDEALENDILLFKVKVDNSNYLGKVSGRNITADVLIDVNGVQNKLTNPNWKYYNNNDLFEYTLLADQSIKTIDITFYEGKYTVSDFEAYALDYGELKKRVASLDEFVINKEETKGDKISGKVDATEDGIFVLTVPYDKGFTIKLDGKEIKYEKTNLSFVGFPVEKGSHNIEIVYEAPLQKVSQYVAFLGAIIFVFIAVIDRKRESKNEKSISNSSVL